MNRVSNGRRLTRLHAIKAGKGIRWLWLICLLWIVLLGSCQPVGYTDDDKLFAEPTPLEAAPVELAHDFALTTLDGATVRLSNLRGRWVLVNFWATWCAPCRDEMPYLDRLAADHADHLSVLAVNMRESEATVRAFAEELDLNLLILLAPDDATLLAYYVRGLPISVLVDPDGNVVQRIIGPIQPGVGIFSKTWGSSTVRTRYVVSVPRNIEKILAS